MQANRWRFWLPYGCSDKMQGASSNFLQSRYCWWVFQLKGYLRPKHKTQHTQQPNELLPPYPPVALSSHFMGSSAAPTTHGATASHGPMLGACGLVPWCHPISWLVRRAQINTHWKIERKWCLGINSFTNKGSDGNEKLPSHSFSTVGIAREFCQASLQLPPQASSPWCSICTPYGV